MRAHRRAAVDAAVDVDGKPHPQRLGDRLRLQHHVPGDLADAGIGAECVERGEGQRRDRVERQVPPQLHPDLVADAWPHRRPEAGRGQRRREPGRASGFPTGRLAEREAVALDVPNHPRRRDLDRGVDDAAEHPLRPENGPLHVARIDRGEARVRKRPLDPVEVPPWDAVHRADDRGRRSEQRPNRRRRGRHGMRLEGDDDIVLRTEGRRVVGHGDRDGDACPCLDQGQAVRSHRREMRPAGDEADSGAGPRQLRAQVTADGPGAEDADTHPPIRLRRSGRASARARCAAACRSRPSGSPSGSPPDAGP